MESSRQRWTQERRRKQPSLYDEYLNQERAQQTPHFSPPSRIVAPSSSSDPHTIRTVTPETSENTPDAVSAAPSSTATSTRSYDRDLLPQAGTPSSSPRNKLQKEKNSPRTLTLSKSALGRSESTDAGKRDNLARLGYGSRRPRTRTLDETTTRDQSPAAGSSSRLRHAALATHASSHSHSASDSLASIGHPQVVSPLSQQSFGSQSNSSAALPQRALSPVSTLASNTEGTDSTGGAMPNANARRILHLMKTLCGRMSGSLAFRRGASCPWTPAYCYIHEESGSLMCEPEANANHHRTLVPDLRGCQVSTAMEEDAQMPYLDISVPNSSLELHIRLKDRNDFDSWFAALLCWRPIRPKGIQNKMTKPQSPVVAGFPLSSSRRNSEMSLTLKEAPIIKVGPMIYWDSNVAYTNAGTPRSLSRPQVMRMQSYGLQWWRRVSCTLRENGEMKLYAENGSTLLSVVQLSNLSRCAIQRLDPSVLDNEFCIAIYPQYTSGTTGSTAVRPIYLSLETRTLYEVWFVLLRAFTIPQLYGPKPQIPEDNCDDSHSPQVFDSLLAASATDLFRMERALLIRIVEARLPPANNSVEANFHHSTRHNIQSHRGEIQDGHYIEIQLDGETRAKTQVKHEGSSPFWREEFEYLDLPAVLTSASVVLRRRPPDLTTAREQHELRLVHEAYGLNAGGQQSGAGGGVLAASHDQTLGKVEIYLEELEASKEIEKWWPVVNPHGENVGEILIKARAEENVILMSRDYEPLNQLLHRFENELTLQIAQMIPGELRRLSDTLLNIFSVSGQVTDWLMALVEEEIDGVHKETPISRLRYSRRVGNNDTDNPLSANSERELMVRDMNKNATLEANLLFRGNTLLTKSLDSHMRRVGKEYLIAALGPTIRDICDKDPDCEVDPNRTASEHELKRNWSRLLAATQDVWIAIRTSAKKAPVELRVIFRHIRACAEDRYGDFLRSVSYSSVSGFLFLRFFCPAVLNPKLFGLLKDDPKPKARRSFTLIAKSLQGLANMASFGSKEHWMEPMNAFLTTHRDAFKSFIDDVCSIPSPEVSLPTENPASYSTPLAIQTRLPMTSREGFPSLPYLIDQSREYAGLVELWLQGTGEIGSSQSSGVSLGSQIAKDDGDLLTFHKACIQLHARTQECLSRAERAERPNSALSFRWEELIEQLQHSTGLDSRPGSQDQEPDTPTRDSFDDVASRAAGSDLPIGVPRTRGPTNGANAANRGGVVLQAGDIPTLSEDVSAASPPSWENDRDAGAASVAASLLTLETQEKQRKSSVGIRSLRSGGGSFDAQRPAVITGATQHRGPGHSNSITIGTLQRDTTSATLPNLPSHSQTQRLEKDNMSTTGSMMSANGTDSDTTTALPSLERERERRQREKKAKEKEKKEDRERRLKDFVPGLMGKRKKDKERE
ncbi:hypothetical protein MBLNU459_g0759t1 [Dothideomycetes sp. NU459]